MYISETYSHHGMSDFYVHIGNVFTSLNEWVLCTYKKRIHGRDWVTFMYISETYLHHGMSEFYVKRIHITGWVTCTYKKRIHVREGVPFM